jgi:hypothetical protein
MHGVINIEWIGTHSAQLEEQEVVLSSSIITNNNNHGIESEVEETLKEPVETEQIFDLLRTLGVVSNSC